MKNNSHVTSILDRMDNNDHPLHKYSLIHFSTFGKFHSVKDKNTTSCGIDFKHKDFEIAIHDQVETHGMCKKCEYYNFNHKKEIQS